jgi:hypothetical protein
MYCYESRGTDVDHFEPIKSDPLRTFDWSNHLLACGYCNQQAKRETFPRGTDGRTLLLDPFEDDSWHHMRQGASGELHGITESGRVTIELLRLNDRRSLVDARRLSWAFIIERFERLRFTGSTAVLADIVELRFLPIVDTLHYFSHDAMAGLLPDRGVPPACCEFVLDSLDILRAAFPLCEM